jgi:hypothetical protein
MIEDFRNVVNEYNIHEVLSDVDGKDDYSFICSQMDWLEAWVNEIEDIDVHSNDFHKRTINIAQFILGVDTIVTASKNLLDYFNYNTEFLYHSNGIFKMDINDFLYFKRIRSGFAIHPIDIDIKRTKEKKFAGWAYSITKDQFEIFIYNQKPNTPAEHVIVKKNELLLLSKKWYDTIENITRHIQQTNGFSKMSGE